MYEKVFLILFFKIFDHWRTPLFIAYAKEFDSNLNNKYRHYCSVMGVKNVPSHEVEILHNCRSTPSCSWCTPAAMT